jgi:hypothetical protein
LILCEFWKKVAHLFHIYPKKNHLRFSEKDKNILFSVQ